MVTAVSIFGLIVGAVNIAVSYKKMGMWFWIGIGLVALSLFTLYGVLTGVAPPEATR